MLEPAAHAVDREVAHRTHDDRPHFADVAQRGESRSRRRLEVGREPLERAAAAKGVSLGVERVEKILEEHQREVRILGANLFEERPNAFAPRLRPSPTPACQSSARPASLHDRARRSTRNTMNPTKLKPPNPVESKSPMNPKSTRTRRS